MCALLKKTTLVALAILVVACAGKKRPEVVYLTPSQQVIKDSPEQREVSELAAVLAESKQEDKDKKAVVAAYTRHERKASEMIDSAKRRSLKADLKAVRTIERARISGCDSSKMSIHPDAVEHSTINSFVKIRVTNLSKVSIDIADAKFGTIVVGLCSGGSMTLFRNRSLHSPDYIQFSYTATGRFPDGSVGIAQSETYSLTRYDWSSGGGQQERTWLVQLQSRAW